MHILWHDNHRKWFRLLRDMTPWSWLWYPQKTLKFHHFLGHFQSKPGHVPRCINRSVLHLRRPTNISVYIMYPCTYYGMTTIGNGLYYFEIWPLEVDFGTSRTPSNSTILGHFRSKPGHVPRCINRSVLHFLGPGHVLFERGDRREQNDTLNRKHGVGYFEV